MYADDDGPPDIDDRPFGAFPDLESLLAADPYSPRPAVPTLEEAAADAQDDLVRLEDAARRVDAERIAALVVAYEQSMADLADRYGPELGTRSSRGASTFFSCIALRTGRNPLHVAHLVDTALTARDRLPRTWAVFQTGAIAWRAVDLAVGQADGLDPDRWDAYDEQAAGIVQTSHRLKHDLRKARERLQDDTADGRARTTFERRAVFLDHGPDGSATTSITGPAADQVAWDAALTKAAIAAKTKDETRTITQLRYDIARDLLLRGLQTPADPADGALAVPTRTEVTVKLVLTVPALAWLGRSTEQALLGGYGPIAMDTAKALAGTATTMVRVLTDPVTGVRLAMDRAVYRAPGDLRRWLAVRDERCRFPGCRRPADLCDVDHLREWQDHGVTDAGNLLTECRGHHAGKTADLWDAELDAGGWARWTDPWGNRFADPPVDPLDPAPGDLLPATASRSDPDEPAPF